MPATRKGAVRGTRADAPRVLSGTERRIVSPRRTSRPGGGRGRRHEGGRSARVVRDREKNRGPASDVEGPGELGADGDARGRPRRTRGQERPRARQVSVY